MQICSLPASAREDTCSAAVRRIATVFAVLVARVFTRCSEYTAQFRTTPPSDIGVSTLQVRHASRAALPLPAKVHLCLPRLLDDRRHREDSDGPALRPLPHLTALLARAGRLAGRIGPQVGRAGAGAAGGVAAAGRSAAGDAAAGGRGGLTNGARRRPAAPPNPPPTPHPSPSEDGVAAAVARCASSRRGT